MSVSQTCSTVHMGLCTRSAYGRLSARAVVTAELRSAALDLSFSSAADDHSPSAEPTPIPETSMNNLAPFQT